MSEGTEATVDDLQKQLDEAKTSLKAANAESAERRRLLKETEADKKKFEGIDLDRYKELEKAEKDRANEKLKAEGKLDELKANMEAETQAKINALQKKLELSLTENSTWKDRYSSATVDKDILAAASKSVAPDHVMMLIKPHISLNDELQPVIKAPGADDIARNEDGTAMSINNYVAKFISDNPHLQPASPGGSGGNNGGKTLGKNSSSQDKIKAGLMKMGMS